MTLEVNDLREYFAVGDVITIHPSKWPLTVIKVSKDEMFVKGPAVEGRIFREAKDDAPRVKPAASNVKCVVLGCSRSASFIIKQLAYCEEHRRVAK